MITETSMHIGSGRSTSVVDLPFYRELITDYPSLPSSSLKGALRAFDRQLGENNTEFFESSGGGKGTISISDSRLLLLPVRSLSSNYFWVTCPYVLERLFRDILRSGNSDYIGNQLEDMHQEFLNLNIREGNYLSNHVEDRIFLEELEFSRAGDISGKIVALIKELMPTSGGNLPKERLNQQLVIISDNDFKWFCSYGLNIVARNQLHEETKISENVWYEEYVNPDTLFYCLVMGTIDDLDKFESLLRKKRKYFQIGANESIGQGWVKSDVQTNMFSGGNT